ncbi:TonB-dependent receptor plug domain-containing protein [Oceanospirillum sediminis]|uniref:TonB-dependent receptor n=1 Tax=Oceanospirillum sediminis TaxID=2760088 RepID=A0A839IPM5_9GAMM|nr:TonB-dependent receptor [Oceanospirillum sediminis]
MKVLKSLPILISGLVLVCSARADQPASLPDEASEGDTWVITGTRTERLLEDTPVRTEVISRTKLDQIHARDLTEALKIVPGLMLKDIHGKGGKEVWLQGLDADRVLILINGRPMTASTGSSVDVAQLATADIERIEIVKGATSALYGSSAMGGVVNVITRKPTEPFSAALVLDMGSYGDANTGRSDLSLGGRQEELASRHARFDIGMKREQWTTQINGSIRDTEGYDLNRDTAFEEGGAGTRKNLSARISFEPDEHKEFFFEPAYYKEDLTAHNILFRPGSGYLDKTEIATRKRLDGGTILAFGDDLLKLSATWENFEDVTEKGDIRIAEQDIYKISSQFDTPVADNQLLTLGIDLSHASMAQEQKKPTASGYEVVKEIGDGSDNSSAEVYLQNDIFLTDQLELLPGFRYQHDTDFGDHLTPKMNLQYTPQWSDTMDVRIRAGIGKGYRVPNLKERYYVFDHSNLGYMVLGNPDLQPEYSTNYQLGIELRPSPDLRFDLNLFRSDLKDLIATSVESVRNNVVNYRYLNIDQARIFGAELAAGYDWKGRAQLDVALTWMDAEDKTTGKPLPKRPEYQLKTGLTIRPFTGFSASLQGIWQSKEYNDLENNFYTPSWTTWDLKLNQQVSEHVRLFMGVDNLLNKTRDPDNPHDQGPHPGRFIYTGLRVDI